MLGSVDLAGVAIGELIRSDRAVITTTIDPANKEAGPAANIPSPLPLDATKRWITGCAKLRN